VRDIMLSGKSFLITGGTGSFGHTLVSKLLSTDISRIIVFSRDEAKQHFMRQVIHDSRLKFVLGDVRNRDSIKNALVDVNYVFHAAALKHVPASEAAPWEFIQTNVIGSHNLLSAISNSNVEKAVFLSTDKAVYPLNSMGMTKALMEKLVRSDFASQGANSVITRYGNVIGSRGSVIPQFIDSIKKTNSVTVTDPNMTRFMMSLDQSVDLVLFAMQHGNSGDLFVQKSPAATVEVVVKALEILMAKSNVKMNNVGIRPGEKIHETLLTGEEKFHSIEHDLYFQVPKIPIDQSFQTQNRDLSNDYTSANTNLLNAEQLAAVLESIPYIKELIG
jgi:UDP-glucose 4-epimerase